MILIVGHDDMAGVGASLAAMLRHHGHEAVSVACNVPFGYRGTQVVTSVNDLADAADVIYVHSPCIDLRSSLYAPGKWLLPINLWKYVGRKPVVAHYHGTELRTHAELRLQHPKVKTVVSTPDLLQWAPEATWLPQPLDAALLDTILTPPSDRITVCQAPSDPDKKHTKILVEASVGAEWELLIARGTHGGVIKAMRAADVIFDHLHPDYYGVAAVEGGALGKVVVRSLGRVLREHVPNCPFVDTTAERLRDTLDDLAGKGRDHLTRLGNSIREWIIDMHWYTAYARLEELIGGQR
jgi:hypothetical protein